MTQPSYVPIVEADQVRPAQRLRTPLPWRAERVADLRTPGQPRGKDFGVPGPDQGYALLIAHQLFAERLELSPGVTSEDALVGAAAVAVARAALFGRAPVAKDVEMALVLFGFLGGAPADLLEWRTARFRGAALHHEQQRTIVDSVREETLRVSADEVHSRLSDWRQLVTAS